MSWLSRVIVSHSIEIISKQCKIIKLTFASICAIREVIGTDGEPLLLVLFHRGFCRIALWVFLSVSRSFGGHDQGECYAIVLVDVLVVWREIFEMISGLFFPRR